jgi:hypothetical protein
MFEKSTKVSLESSEKEEEIDDNEIFAEKLPEIYSRRENGF